MPLPCPNETYLSTLTPDPREPILALKITPSLLRASPMCWPPSLGIYLLSPLPALGRPTLCHSRRGVQRGTESQKLPVERRNSAKAHSRSGWGPAFWRGVRQSLGDRCNVQSGGSLPQGFTARGSWISQKCRRCGRFPSRSPVPRSMGELPPQLTIQAPHFQIPLQTTSFKASRGFLHYYRVQIHASPCKIWPLGPRCQVAAPSPLLTALHPSGLELLKQTMLPDPPRYSPLPSGLCPHYPPVTTPLPDPQPWALLCSPASHALICGQRAPEGSLLPTAAPQQLDWGSGYCSAYCLNE